MYFVGKNDYVLTYVCGGTVNLHFHLHCYFKHLLCDLLFDVLNAFSYFELNDTNKQFLQIHIPFCSLQSCLNFSFFVSTHVSLLSYFSHFHLITSLLLYFPPAHSTVVSLLYHPPAINILHFPLYPTNGRR